MSSVVYKTQFYVFKSFRDNQNLMIKAQIDLDLGADTPKTEKSMKYDFLEPITTKY